MLSEQSITKYCEIYRKVYGVEISREEAAEQAQRLLSVARIVHQPTPKKFEKRYRELLEQKIKRDQT